MIETSRNAVFLCIALVAGAPQADANVAGSVTGTTAAQPPEVTIVMDGGNRIARFSSRTLLASLEGRLVLPVSNKPRRSVSEVKPKTSGNAAQGVASQAGDPPSAARADAPLETVAGPGPGQTGYVHFFLLETPDGEGEIQVGVELADGRIAWSFPEVGVSVVPFVRAGAIEVGGRAYGVEHLYGLRPFADPESMTALRSTLGDRVSLLVDGRIPYCNPFLRSETLCLSCLGFVLETLFPGRTPGRPAMPVDFPRTKSRLYYTTDDLLLYLTGFHEIGTAEARARRIEALTLPPYLAEELWQLVEAFDMKDAPGTIDTGKLKNTSTRPPAAGRYTRTPPQRKRL